MKYDVMAQLFIVQTPQRLLLGDLLGGGEGGGPGGVGLRLEPIPGHQCRRGEGDADGGPGPVPETLAPVEVISLSLSLSLSLSRQSDLFHIWLFRYVEEHALQYFSLCPL